MITKEQKLQFIREKCIETNPEIVFCDCRCHNGMQVMRSATGLCLDCKCDGLREVNRPIRLADILLATKIPVLVDRNGIFYSVDSIKALNIGVAYDLLHDSLSEQSEETINFLCSLFPDYEKLR